MKHCSCFAVTVSLLFLSSMQLMAEQRQNTLTPEEIKAGWELLWDGRTTDGWRAVYLDSFPESGWIIENGQLICLGEEVPEETRGGAIVSEKMYGSFELTFEFKIKKGANSGIKYFIDERLKASMGHGLGLEFAILDDDSFPYPDPDAKRTCGSLYDLVKAAPNATRPLGEWNQGRIVVRGNQIEHWLNGKRVVQVEKGTPHYYELVSDSKYKKIEDWGEFSQGHILIQDEGPRTAFRAIRIRSLNERSRVEVGQQPNILLIYLDDLGYGDLSCTNPDSKIPTPNIDRLASEGIQFTDAHSPAAICGPSRYGLLTGRYPWRRGKSGVGNGPKFRDLFIEENGSTIASFLKQQGYNTAQMGKWGLRHNYSEAVIPGKKPGTLKAYDFKHKKLLGSQLVGFDYSWCITYLDKTDSDTKFQFENGSPVDPELTPTNPYRWLPDSAGKVIEYLEVYAGKAKNPHFGILPEKPFFIYWDPPSPHEPIVPNPEFIGKTKAGAYGDFVFEIDHYIGRMLETLDKHDLTRDTLVIFASDNGPDRNTYERLKEFDHQSMHIRRGIKTDSLEGGHRMPLIVRWPGVVKAKRRSDAIISFTDWFATIAEITGQDLLPGTGEDSLSFYSLLRREKGSTRRHSVIHHTPQGVFAIRQGNWVYIDSGNPPSDEPGWFRQMRGVTPGNQPGQLYNLNDDPSQSENLYLQYPEKVQQLKQLLAQAKAKD